MDDRGRNTKDRVKMGGNERNGWERERGRIGRGNGRGRAGIRMMLRGKVQKEMGGVRWDRVRKGVEEMR
jgi:hypothetical protein